MDHTGSSTFQIKELSNLVHQVKSSEVKYIKNKYNRINTEAGYKIGTNNINFNLTSISKGAESNHITMSFLPLI